MTKPFASPVSCVGLGDLIVNRDYLDILESCGLSDFRSICHYAPRHIIKKTRERTVARIDVCKKGGKRCFYLKHHNVAHLRPCDLVSRLIFGRRSSQGHSEFKNICDFRKNGIPTVRPVAAGERYTGLFREESFLITEAFDPFVSLENIIQNRPEFLQGTRGEQRKTILMEEIAHLARDMHRSGFNHRDFNATHVLLRYDDGRDTPELALFDLQRVDRTRLLRFRWFIKTMAELNYTLPDSLFNTEHRLHLYRSYKGKDHLNLWDWLQLFWIKRKVARIKRHTENILKRRAERRRRGLPER